ncbi:sigma-70 RNA polymerase sigma factor region 4 domain-containing protein [Enterococcus mundtii]|uniref:sigma-70 family RNA polymerase sigma factor n=1 Tax=Enterococcus mundtii TaxID=53346 RepID=UPI001E59D760|nr:sigma-70 family RNA polymerase sigma factor [Enterococcus mundtii]
MLELKIDLKINTRELHRWSNYSDGDDGDLAKHQKFLTALQKQKYLKGVVERLNDRIERLEKERKEIIELIDQFNGLNNRILKLKYVEGMTLESVAEETGYTYQYIKNKHAELMRIIKFNKKV